MRAERIRARQLRARFTATLYQIKLRSAFSTHVCLIIMNRIKAYRLQLCPQIKLQYRI